MPLSNRSGYSLQTGASTLASPADATTYYTGSVPSSAPLTTVNFQPVSIPKAGTIRAASVNFFNNGGTVGSNENSTVYLRHTTAAGVGTDYAISSTVDNSQAQNTSARFTSSSLAISVAAGDSFEVKWITPTWATNPTQVRITSSVYIEV